MRDGGYTLLPQTPLLTRCSTGYASRLGRRLAFVSLAANYVVCNNIPSVVRGWRRVGR